MDKNGLSCFLLGLGVGVGIGMLFAPKSGQETREIIKNKAGEGTDYIKQRGSEFKDTAAGRVDDQPKPFIWTAKAADILEKVKRARKSLDNRHSA
jgi:gas vesicle protein